MLFCNLAIINYIEDTFSLFLRKDLSLEKLLNIYFDYSREIYFNF